MTVVRLSGRASEVMQQARAEVEHLGHAVLRAEHILLGIIAVPDGSAARVLDSLEIDRVPVRNRIAELVPKGKVTLRDVQYPIGTSGLNVFQSAIATAEIHGSREVTTACILLGILALKSTPLLVALAATRVDLPLLRSRLEAHAADPE